LQLPAEDSHDPIVDGGDVKLRSLLEAQQETLAGLERRVAAAEAGAAAAAAAWSATLAGLGQEVRQAQADLAKLLTRSNERRI